MLSPFMIYEFAKEKEQRICREAEQSRLAHQLDRQQSCKPKLTMQDIIDSLRNSMTIRPRIRLN